ALNTDYATGICVLGLAGAPLSLLGQEVLKRFEVLDPADLPGKRLYLPHDVDRVSVAAVHGRRQPLALLAPLGALGLALDVVDEGRRDLDPLFGELGDDVFRAGLRI